MLSLFLELHSMLLLFFKRNQECVRIVSPEFIPPKLTVIEFEGNGGACCKMENMHILLVIRRHTRM